MNVRVVLVIALGVGFAGAAAGDGPDEEADLTCAETIALRVQHHYRSIRDLQADFVQTTQVATLGPMDDSEAMRSAGTVVFAKPGRMRWSYREPEESLVVTDGESLWTFDAQLREAQHVAVGAGFLSGAAIQFLLGEGDILASFRVTSPDCAGQPVTLGLEPHEPATYERLVAEVDPATGRVAATEVTDLFGSVTRVAFQNVRTNTDPDEALFRFEPPEGVRVIEAPGAP